MPYFILQEVPLKYTITIKKIHNELIEIKSVNNQPIPREFCNGDNNNWNKPPIIAGTDSVKAIMDAQLFWNESTKYVEIMLTTNSVPNEPKYW